MNATPAIQKFAQCPSFVQSMREIKAEFLMSQFDAKSPTYPKPDYTLSNEDFALDMYHDHMNNCHAFFVEEVDMVLNAPSATLEDLCWSQGARAIARKQVSAACYANLRTVHMPFTFNLF